MKQNPTVFKRQRETIKIYKKNKSWGKRHEDLFANGGGDLERCFQIVVNTQLTFTFSKSTIETLEKGMKYV